MVLSYSGLPAIKVSRYYRVHGMPRRRARRAGTGRYLLPYAAYYTLSTGLRASNRTVSALRHQEQHARWVAGIWRKVLLDRELSRGS